MHGILAYSFLPYLLTSFRWQSVRARESHAWDFHLLHLLHLPSSAAPAGIGASSWQHERLPQ
jgi:hypothetical protein